MKGARAAKGAEGMEGEGLRAVMRRAGRVLREEGARSLWFKALGETVYRRLLLVERDLGEPIPEVGSGVPVVIGLLGRAEIDEYVDSRAGADAIGIGSRLQAGHWCIVARHRGHIVCTRWAATGRVWIDYLSRELALGPGDAYSYDLYTAPEARGHHVSPAASAFMLRHLREAGCCRVLAAISPENRSSLRSVTRTGYRPRGRVGYVKLGPWVRHFGEVPS